MAQPSTFTLSPQREALAIRFLQEGVIKFGAPSLRVVGTSEDVAPVRVNLHTPRDPKPGPLRPDLLWEIGRLMHEDLNIRIPFTYVVGDPTAGESIASAFITQRRIPKRFLFHVEKQERGERWIRRLPPEQRTLRAGPVLLLDDVLTRGNGKLATKQLLQSYGFSVPIVAVVISRDQGGSSLLLQSGVSVVFSLFDLWTLTQFYRSKDLITEQNIRETDAYLHDH